MTTKRGPGAPRRPRPDNLAGRFGAEMELRRKSLGWSISDLSSECGVSCTTLHDIEAGAREPRLGAALAIARALQCPLVALIVE